MALDTKSKLSSWMKKIMQPNRNTKKTTAVDNNTNQNIKHNGTKNVSSANLKKCRDDSHMNMTTKPLKHHKHKKNTYYNTLNSKPFYSETTLNLPNDNVSMIPIVPNDNYSIHWDEEIERTNRELLNSRELCCDINTYNANSNSNYKRDNSADNSSIFPLQSMMTNSVQSTSIFSTALGNSGNFNATGNHNTDQMSYQSTRPTIVSSIFTIDSLASVRPIVPGSILFNSRAPSIRTMTS